VSVPAQAGDPTCSTSGGVTVGNRQQVGTVGSRSRRSPLSATGGTAPYTWSAPVSRPASPSVPPRAPVSGTPTTGRYYNVTATATASAGGSGNTTFTITVTGGGGGAPVSSSATRASRPVLRRLGRRPQG